MVRVLLDEDIDVEFRNHLGEEVLAETVQFRGLERVQERGAAPRC